MKKGCIVLVLAGILLLCLVQGGCAAENYSYVMEFETHGGGVGQFETPVGIYADQNYVYVSDLWLNRTQEFSASTGDYYSFYGSEGSGTGQFNRPWGVTYQWDGTGQHLYIVDNGNARVQRYNFATSSWDIIGTRGLGPGQFASPSGIGVNSSGFMYVTDGDRVEIFDNSGTYVNQIQSYGSGDGQFERAYGVAFDSQDNVYVVDALVNRVQKFTKDLEYVSQWGNTGSGDGEFEAPQGIAVGPSDEVFVADTNNNRIQEFASDGSYLGQWGSLGAGPGQFNTPAAVSVDNHGNVFVLDTYNYRVQEFAPQPVTLNGAGWLEYYAGEDIKFYGYNTQGSPTYLFMTGPELPPQGVQLTGDPGNASVTEGDAGTFSQAPVSGAKWVYYWNTTEDIALNITTARDNSTYNWYSNFTIYAESAPHDAANFDPGNSQNITIKLQVPFISATANVSSGEPGQAFWIGGVKEGCHSPNCYVSIFIKNDTVGGNLPVNGTFPEDLSVESVTGVDTTFGQGTVYVDQSFNYVWDTSSITGGSLLPDSGYMIIVSMRPMNWPDLREARIRNLSYAGYYTKLQVAILGPMHPDYTVNTTSGTGPLAVEFRDLSGGVDETYINFGDGTEANISSYYYTPTVHTYANPGTYIPVIYAMNSTGTASRTNATITVSPSTGSIITDSSPPGAEIFIDGTDSMQQTRSELFDVPSGYHHVKVTLSGSYPQEQSVYVHGGTNNSVFFTLDPISASPGYLSVVSNITGAEIYVDGMDTGHTTAYNFTGYLGNHTVTLTYPGYFNATRQVTVPSGEVADAYITMDPVPPVYSGTVLTNVKRMLKEELDDNTAAKSVYSLPVRLEKSQTFHLWGVQPPIATPDSESTVLFIDPTPTANWEHPCSYVFIDALGNKTKIDRLSPATDLALGQIAGISSDPAGENQNSIGSGSTPSTGGGLGVISALSPICTSTTCGDGYAVLIDGGYDAENNHIRYWNDISFMYQTLNRSYGFPKDHIMVYMSDGTSNGIDRHNWTNQDLTIKKDSSPLYFDGASSETQVSGDATYATVSRALTDLQNSKYSGKNIFIFTTGHGAWDASANNGRGDSFLYLWNGDKIYATDFVSILKPTTARSITVVMEQCYSGGFVTPFMDPANIASGQKRMIATASSASQPSNDNGFSSTWTMAMGMLGPDGRPAALADLSPVDQKVSVSEASTYAQNNDPYKSIETPQYSSTKAVTGAADGDSQYLFTSCSAPSRTLKLTSPNDGDSWSVGYTRNITWGQTGLDPKSPVVISLWNRSPLTKVVDIQTVPVSNGFYRWTITRTGFKVGVDYQLRITNVSNNLYDQKSLILLAWSTPGKVNLNSSPVQGAWITADGLNISKKTNVTGFLSNDYTSAGTHYYRLDKTGYAPVEGKYFILGSNQVNDVSQILRPTGQNGLGMMEISSSPVRADVLVDGIPAGKKTPFSEQYAPGTYIVGVRAAGYITPPDKTLRIFDKPVSADFSLIPANAHRAVFRGINSNKNWFFDANMDGVVDRQDKFGKIADIPLVADFNNDGVMDRAVFRSVTKGNNWFIDYGTDGTIDRQDRFGQIGDIPLVADFNNDGMMDRAVFRDGAWIVDYSMDGTVDKQDRFGQAGDIPVVGDFNGDGVMDRAVFRSVTRGNNWFIDYSMDGTVDMQDRFGQIGDIPLIGDFNSDGVMDRAVFRGLSSGNNWIFDYGMDATIDRQDRFGQIGDLPVFWNS